MMISLNQIELALAACGGLSIVWTIFRLGQLWERYRHRRKRHIRLPKPTAEVVKFKTRNEVTAALATEINKGKHGNADVVERLVRQQNEFRKAV